ncbi:DUF1805 domain-containing protein [Ornithinibacillus gellani]|uniref:YunC family protein n=1 Tax=Ornithinibacillus gellani TaxID=2293253 RepID=UPI000F49CB80|nr:DUF1805 domain-containing protein [Ornithinibacillus gellani]TQS75999.1 DUF1805 domain-containing protein [Ornithinibacillus gellani]
MITINPLEVEGLFFTAIRVELPKTNLLIISNEVGYIMCAALDVDVLNEKLKDRQVIAGRASGVRTIDELLHAPLEKVTDASRKHGWKEGMSGREALLRIA